MDQPTDLDGELQIQDDNFLLDTISANDNLRILYITLTILVVVLILWVVIIISTNVETLAILSEMNNVHTNVVPISDL